MASMRLYFRRRRDLNRDRAVFQICIMYIRSSEFRKYQPKGDGFYVRRNSMPVNRTLRNHVSGCVTVLNINDKDRLCWDEEFCVCCCCCSTQRSVCGRHRVDDSGKAFRVCAHANRYHTTFVTQRKHPHERLCVRVCVCECLPSRPAAVLTANHPLSSPPPSPIASHRWQTT